MSAVDSSTSQGDTTLPHNHPAAVHFASPMQQCATGDPPNVTWRLGRLEREVLGGRLWHAACRDLNADLPASLPLAFGSTAEYVATFEPLLFEEAREAVRGGWAEGAENGRCWATDVTSCAI